MTSTPTDALPRTTPAEVGVDPAGVEAFVAAVEAAPDLELHSLMLLRHGQVYAQAWWRPYQPDDAPLLYSLSKSVTSTALGFAVAEGRLALTDRVVDHLTPAHPVGPRAAAITLRDLVAMATGHREDALDPARRLDPVDPAQGFLRVEPDQEPGSVFAYNNAATYTLGTVVQQVTGQTLTAYLTPRLFEPLGITPGSWDQHPAGREVGFTGLHLRTDAIARFGQLYLDDGHWQGRRVLPEGWVGLATSLHTPNPAEPNPDWRQGYGFQFWRGRHGSVRGDGAYGQFCVLLPKQDAVLVTTAATENMQGILDAAWTHLLPAFDRAAPGDAAAAQARLDARLADPEIDPDRRRMTTEGAGALSVSEVGRGPHGWRLVLAEGERRFPVLVGRDGWVRDDVPVAPGRGLTVAARGREDAGTLTADVVLVETPHRLRVVAGPSGSSVAWHTAPLGEQGLAGLATPRG